MLLKINKVAHLGEYRLELHFNDESVKVVDLSAELHGTVFEPLQNLSLFRQVAVNPETNTIEWPTGADLAPEYLHEIGQETTRRVTGE